MDFGGRNIPYPWALLPRSTAEAMMRVMPQPSYLAPMSARRVGLSGADTAASSALTAGADAGGDHSGHTYDSPDFPAPGWLRNPRVSARPVVARGG